MRHKSKMAKICVKLSSYVLAPIVSLFCAILVLFTPTLPKPRHDILPFHQCARKPTLPTGAER